MRACSRSASTRRASVWSFAGWALAFFLVAGCVSPGRRLAPKLAREIGPGQTRAEVESRLGAPRTEQSLADGRALAIYRYTVAQESPRTDLLVDFPDRRVGTFRFAGDLNFRVLTVLYSPAGQVERALYSETRTPYYEELTPSADAIRQKWVGTEITPAVESSWRRQVTTRAELELQLGSATWKSFTAEGPELCGWVYEALVGRRFPESRAQELVAAFDANGVLIDWNLTQSNSSEFGPKSRKKSGDPAALNPP